MKTDKPPIPTADWLKWLGERRDGFLIGGAVLYGLGYLVWSYNAWRNHLGQLPAIEFQYLMSGLIPGAIIGMAWAATTFFSSMRDKAIAFSKKYRLLYGIILTVLFAVPVTISFGVAAADKRWLHLGWTKEQRDHYMFPLMLAVMYFSLLSWNRAPSRFARFADWLLLSVYRYVLAVIFCWYSLVIYFDLYPRLPQELGGPKPRCAYIDLVREDIAPSSLAVLVPSPPVDAATASQSKVVRSNKLNVYFSSSDYLLVRTATDAKDASSANLKNAPLYELRKEVIRLVQWCPE
jgi:hypothetical protein